jgi:hypothetical protein
MYAMCLLHSLGAVENGDVLFNTTTPSSNIFNGLIFKDQYIEFSSQLPEDPYIYGLGTLSLSFLRFRCLSSLVNRVMSVGVCNVRE